jgi:uncharacterized membrane protein YkvA (DUF1232 family)
MLRSLLDAAQQVLSRRFRVVLLVRDAYDRMTAHPSALSAVWSDLNALLRLVVAWLQRSYQQVSWTPLVIIVGGLLYFVTPTDLIPDMFGAIGFVDDVTVISTVVHTVRDELDRFREWEQNNALSQ